MLDTNDFNIYIDDAHCITDENGTNKLFMDGLVNQLDITNAATGNAPSIQATGGDSNS